MTDLDETNTISTGDEVHTVSQEEFAKIAETHNIWLGSSYGHDTDLGLRADFRGVIIKDVDMSGVDLNGADFENAEFYGVVLRDSRLSYYGDEEVNIPTNFTGAVLRNVALTGSDLQKAILEDADLSGAKLEGTDLRGANLFGAILEDADLRGCDLRGAELRDSKFGNADLQDANLVEAMSLMGEQLAGTNLSGAKLPNDIANFQRLNHVTEVSRHARNVFLALIAGCIYTWLTILTTTDLALVTNAASTPLPIIQAKVPIAEFYMMAPVVLLVIFFYMHMYLQRLWEGLASLPAIFPDGYALDERTYPWLLSSLVRGYVPLLKKDRPTLWWANISLSILGAWILLPATLLYFWIGYLPKHDVSGTLWLVVLLLVSIWSGFFFFRLAVNTLKRRESPRIHWSIRSLVSGAFLAFLIFLSFMATWGLPPGIILAKARLERADLQKENLSQLNLRGARLGGANLFEANLQLAQLAWADFTDAYVSRANLRDADLEGAFFFRTNLQETVLEGSNLSKANLREAKLGNADLRGAKMAGARLQGAELFYAKGITQSQLDEACGDHETKLPKGLTIKPCKP